MEGPEKTIPGAAGEDQVAAGGQQRAPVEGLEVRRPDFLAGFQVPRLNLADVIRTLDIVHLDVGDRYAKPQVTRGIRHVLADQRAAQIVVGRNVEQAGIRIVRLRRPILAAPQRRAEVDLFTYDRLVGFVVGRPAGVRIDAGEDVLADIFMGIDKADIGARATVEQPQITVTPGMDETVDLLAVAFERYQKRR